MCDFQTFSCIITLEIVAETLCIIYDTVDAKGLNVSSIRSKWKKHRIETKVQACDENYRFGKIIYSVAKYFVLLSRTLSIASL